MVSVHGKGHAYKEQISLTNSNHIRENLMEIISQDR